MRQLLLFFFFFFTFLNVKSQSLNFRFRCLNTTISFSNSASPYVFKDSKGLLWVSTIDGVNIFDGNNNQIYKQAASIDPNSSNGLFGNIMQGTFFEDANNDIWFTSYTAINCYRRNQNKFEHYFLYDKEGKILDISYFGYYLDKKGVFWIKNKGTEHFYFFNTINKTQFLKPYFPHDNFVIEAENSQFKCLNYQKDILFFTRLNEGYDLQETREIKIDNKSINGIRRAYIKENKIYILNNIGLIVLNTDNQQVVASLKGDFYSLVFSTSTDILLLSNKGISSVNIQTFQINHTITNNDLGIKESEVNNLFKDKDDGLWATNDLNIGNIYYSNISPKTFKSETLRNPKGEVVQTNLLQVNSKDEVFSYTIYSKVIQVFDAKTKTKIREIAFPKALSEKGRISFFIDSDDNLWLTDRKNLQCLKNGKWIKFTNKKSFAIWNIKEITNKRVVLCTSEGLFEPKGTEIRKINILNDSNYGITEVLQDKNGILCLNVEADKLIFTKFINDSTLESIKTILLKGFFNDYWENTNKDEIWLACNIGLVRLDTKDYSTTIFNKEEALVNQNFVKIKVDKKGNLWLASTKGIVNYNPNTSKCRIYDITDGLVSEEFIVLNSVSTSNGNLWLGGKSGIVIFNPESIESSIYKAPIHVKNFKVNDVLYQKSIVTTASSPLKLRYDENNISLEITAIDFVNPQKTRTAYFLEGWDTKWDTCLTSVGFIRYTNLSSGTYRLLIASANADGVWSTDFHVIHIKINPPFYYTWWFLTLCALCIFAIGYRLYQQQLNRVRVQEQMKAKITEVELKALRAQMNPHFVNNCLNAISNFILKNDNENGLFYLTKFSRLMRMVLNHSKEEFITLFDEVNALTYYIEMESLRFSAQFSYKIEIDPSINPKNTMISPMLVQPFVENAIWHGLLPQKGGEVQIKFTLDDDYVKCIIQDNGIGRKKSEESKPLENKDRKSYGMSLIKDRLNILNKNKKLLIEDVETIDLHDENGKPIGTKIILNIPMQSINKERNNQNSVL